jgi:hypothetical protein
MLVDVWKRAAEIATIISGISGLYVIFKPQVAGTLSQLPLSAPANLPVVILGICIISASVINLVATRQKPALPTVDTQASQQSQTEHTSSTRAPIEIVPIAVSAALALLGSKTVLPDGREVISCTREGIQALFKANTIDQFNRLLRGQWLKMSGTLEENHGGGRIYLEAFDPMIWLKFAEGWEEHLSTLPKGSSITFRGKLKGADSTSVHLQDCELL